MKSPRKLIGFLAFALTLAAAPAALAAPPWVDRAITLPRHDWAFDFGLGVAHAPGTLAPGFNLEAALGVAHRLQIGLRTGFRFGADARVLAADVYGRTFDTETYGTGSDVVANPEFYIRGGIVEGDVVELGLEGRVMSPFSQGLGLMFGMPLVFHFGRAARLDTGVYVPVLFYDPTVSLVSIPAHLWFQANSRLWLGPLSGVRVRTSQLPGEPPPFDRPFFARSRTEVPLGFGLGIEVTRAFDFRTWFLFQDVANGEAERWGFGVGLEVRIE
jgi:hypothetical protein